MELVVLKVYVTLLVGIVIVIMMFRFYGGLCGTSLEFVHE